MGHYSKVKDGVVENVVVADADFIATLEAEEGVEWIKTSYNTRGGVHYVANTSHSVPSPDQSKSLRKNFGGIGMLYDKERDAFYTAQPFPSWILNEDSCEWEAPVKCQTEALLREDEVYIWNEAMLKWDVVSIKE